MFQYLIYIYSSVFIIFIFKKEKIAGFNNFPFLLIVSLLKYSPKHLVISL